MNGKRLLTLVEYRRQNKEQIWRGENYFDMRNCLKTGTLIKVPGDIIYKIIDPRINLK